MKTSARDQFAGTVSKVVLGAINDEIVTDDAGVRFSARNRFCGKVASVKPGAVNTEVVITLPEGGSVASMVTHDSAERPGIKVGEPASAIFKASSVIIAAPV